MTLDRDALLKSANISDDDFLAAEIEWDILEEIYEDYSIKCQNLKDEAQEFSNLLYEDQENAKIHSIRHRVKSAEHLIAKIIRKRTENADKYENINRDNYHEIINDLIGVRVFLLYKEDWEFFHKFILKTFENNKNLYNCFEKDKNNYLYEEPKVYIRLGDKDIYGNEIKVEPRGDYRSLHYIVKMQNCCIEIQARTLFEEGWGEIDHDIVYPNYTNNICLKNFSQLLNRLAGMADEMGSYFKYLKDDVSSITLNSGRHSLNENPKEINSNQINSNEMITLESCEKGLETFENCEDKKTIDDILFNVIWKN